MEVGVFERTETTDKLISASLYNFVIGATLVWGFFVNWLMVLNIPAESIAAVNPIIFFVGYLASCFFGIYLFSKSDNPLVSFIGYNFVVVPFGLIINLVVSRYNPDIVLEAIRVTGLVTFVMMLLGSMYPAFFKKISGALTIALLCVIVVELVEIFIFNTHHGILDWIVALIFCGYIGYDWARANAIPKTYDNAVDSAAALYMDIINLFLRILRILGRR
ncbi:Bax inhibitor-1 family protein [Agarivorans sp. MS3-6]|uniref:Bax inhibitor-1 family protein n=1 Tax=Agarivorans sp. TSD2052 TaxID=2937286 RepID=UPI002010372A|nr:Bax inhibitor-1 family protein [Agarivorans sp. TSD2052]UPW17274.1 Bax inhibitor-1 family protein [Agarivorans sp. TSD2052]